MSEALDHVIQEAAGLTPEGKKAQVDADLQKTEAAASTQVASPSSAQAGTFIVDRASFPSLLGMAIENGLLKNKDNVTTVDLNLFAFLGMARPQVVYDQSRYENYEWLRRFGGTASFGGKGLKFDRNGDGMADEPLEAKEFGDIVTWEVRVRPWWSQSRDPRESYNYKLIAQAVESPQSAYSEEETNFLTRHDPKIKEMNEGGTGCVESKVWNDFIETPKVKTEIASIGAKAKATIAARDDYVKTISNRLVWALFAGGIERKPQFGPNSIRAGLKLDWRQSSLNLEWMKTDALIGEDDPKSLKAGYKYTTKWLKGRATSEGVDLSASGSYEKFRDDPDAKHDTV
ncbi:MAG TPA: hypothetical protein VGX68_07850, partial [Thermoanaerobaculia bacterium]|nr:hypothetical protein [Thermoanaerobaculia bacterium]